MSRSYADMVSDLLRNDATPPPRFPSDRQKLVDAVERGLRSRVQRQQMIRWTLSASAAAAVLVLVIGGKTLLSPYTPAQLPGLDKQDQHDKTVASANLRVVGLPEQQGAVMFGAGAARLPIAEGMPLPQGFRLVAPPGGEVRIGAARGTTLALEGGAELAISEASIIQRYELKVGAVRARVAKLVPGERFIIATSDAEVEVHGTAFRVAVVPADPSCGGGTITRVSVTEGVVSVRRGGAEVQVTPGHYWPDSCEAAAATSKAGAPGGHGHGRGGVARPVAMRTQTPAVAARQTVAVDAPEPAPVEAPVMPTVPLTRSELAAQNDLFASAVRAKRHGQGAQAVRIFDRLTRQYPGGPLAESAAVQRMKLLAAIDLVAASRAASDYLSRYPLGFARLDAHQIIEAAR
ncbi:MAG TPA: FecR domain-containing protein [Polyangia bacterium]|nr:FecR domain-containing protein [Polyangia bacterium]